MFLKLCFENLLSLLAYLKPLEVMLHSKLSFTVKFNLKFQLCLIQRKKRVQIENACMTLGFYFVLI